MHYYKIAANGIDKLRHSFTYEESKFELQTLAKEIYAGAIAACYDLYQSHHDVEHIKEAFAFFEKSKSTILRESIHSAALNSIRGVPDGVLKRERTMRRELRLLQSQLRYFEGINANDSLVAAQRELIFRKEVSMDSMVAAIKDTYPNYYYLK